MNREKIYERLPLALQHAAISLYGGKLRLQRFGLEYLRHKQWLRKTDALSREELHRLQSEELVRFLRHVHQGSAYYRELWASTRWEDVRSATDLGRLPVVSKQQVRQNVERIRVGKGLLDISLHTGGTTGTPLEVTFMRADFERRMAMQDFHREKWGFFNGMRRATFSGRTMVTPGSRVFYRHNAALNQRLYSTFHLAEENLPSYIEDLDRFRPEMIDGFPTAITVIAEYMLRHGITLRHKPRVIWTTSETLYDVQREPIVRAFGCPAANFYASAEGAPFVVECPAGSLHHDLRSGVIEMPRSPDEGIVVTSFTTRRTPLVRYAIGDRIVPAADDSRCSCGSGNPLVKAVLGREQDYLVSPTRGRVGVGLVDIFKKTPSVFRRSQIVQRELGAVELLLVADNEAEARQFLPVLEVELRKRMGDEQRIEFRFVSDIPPERNGKYRYIKNLLAPSAPKEPRGAAS